MFAHLKFGRLKTSGRFPAACRGAFPWKSSVCLLLAMTAVASGADPKVRWRNISRERLPQDVAAVALEYTVVLVKNGQERAVDPNAHMFDVGDRILVRIQPKDDMYIYVFTQGPQGDRDCLLPASDETAPLVKKDQLIELPNDGFFRFDDPPGEEKLIVVATAEPSKDLSALSNVVFRKPIATLTEQEKKERANLLGQNDKRLNSSSNQKVAARSVAAFSRRMLSLNSIKTSKSRSAAQSKSLPTATNKAPSPWQWRTRAWESPNCSWKLRSRQSPGPRMESELWTDTERWVLSSVRRTAQVTHAIMRRTWFDGNL